MSTENSAFPNDVCQLLQYWQEGGDSFGCLIFQMICKADSVNRAKIKLAWPEYLRVWERWNHEDGPEWLSQLLKGP